VLLWVMACIHDSLVEACSVTATPRARRFRSPRFVAPSTVSEFYHFRFCSPRKQGVQLISSP
jgi:hypothetical protein